MKKIRKRKINQLWIMLILSVSILLGCSKQTSEELPSTMDMRDIAIEHQNEVVKQSRLTNAEAIEKHYGGNLYFEDYGTLSEELNIYFKEQLEKEFREHAERPLYIDPHIEFYNLTLKKVKDSELEFSDVYDDMNEYVKYFNIDLLHYLDQEKVSLGQYGTKFGYYFTDVIRENFEAYNIREWSIRYIDLTAADENIKASNQTFVDQYEHIIAIMRYGSVSSSHVRINEKSNYVLSQLEDMYSEKFQIIGGPHADIFGYLVSPVNDPELYFEVSTSLEGGLGKNRFLSLVAQDYMSKEVERIIREEGAEDYIAQLSYPDDRSRSYSIGASFSREDFEGNEITFLNDIYEEDFDITLIYLLGQNEEIDKDVVANINKKIHRLINKDRGMTRTVVMTYFYEVTDKEREIAIDLFKKNYLTEHFYREGSRNIGDYAKNRYFDRAENDAFHYLDVYAKKREYMLFVSDVQFTIEDKTADEIFKLAKQRSPLKDWKEE